MASKHRNMFYKKKQETTEIGFGVMSPSIVLQQRSSASLLDSVIVLSVFNNCILVNIHILNVLRPSSKSPLVESCSTIACSRVSSIVLEEFGQGFTGNLMDKNDLT
ncbi:hypothetical protein AAG570_013738 [Ranatra chinensis]|uniref:Uncharacterized protein n=1 Tax=Ranatra chinensis TaxID=642074 RepID=A0ABD0YVJ7_9HEMI